MGCSNALIPILTILGPIIADVFTGSFFIETLFRIPGLGRYFTSSILNRDYPMIMGTTLLLAALVECDQSGDRSAVCCG